jgi:hypothetical protein
VNQTEISILTSLINDAATLARRINALAWEFNRMVAEDGHTRTQEQCYAFNLIADAMRRSGEEMTTAITVADRVIAEAREANR